MHRPITDTTLTMGTEAEQVRRLATPYRVEHAMRLRGPTTSRGSPSMQASNSPEAAVNLRPIIGILAQPGDVVGENEAYFSAGYVKWLESAGARVMPIEPWLSRKELEHK